MLRYLIRRFLIMIPTLFVTSVLIFTVMQLPPSDYFETYVAEVQAQGEKADLGRIEFLKKEYGLDQPAHIQYFRWITGFFRGDFGYSFEYDMPVRDVVGERLGLTILVSFCTIIMTWLVAFPIGIYSATHQYSWGDYGLSFIGLLGIAIPHFLLALVMLYFANVWFGLSIGGLMDPQYFNQPMSWEKAQSILAHLWIPVLIIGAGGTGTMIRKIRANLLDELRKQYVVTAKAKGLPPNKVLMKYPFRMSLNFFVSDIGSVLPAVVSGAEIVAIVLSLPTTGPLLIRALQAQDMYLAGSFLMFLAILTVIGVLISDIALAFLDPRVRLQGQATK
jgi:peptide/nickel transport system permease protein